MVVVRDAGPVGQGMQAAAGEGGRAPARLAAGGRDSQAPGLDRVALRELHDPAQREVAPGVGRDGQDPRDSGWGCDRA